MKYAYAAIFENEYGKVQVSVPDLRGCFTFGDNLIDAMEMAWDAMSMWLAKAEDQREAIPIPTDIRNIEAEKGFVSMVMADTDKYREILDNYETETVEIGVSQSAMLLSAVN